MSTDDKQPLEAAKFQAMAFRSLFDDCYDRWIVAGSIRRDVAMVGDIEHVIVPRFGDRPGDDMFATPTRVNLVWHRLEQLLAAGTIEKARYGETGGHRWGQKYRGVVYGGFKHELFTASPASLGLILTIRTGPAEFSKRFVMKLKVHGYEARDGQVWPQLSQHPINCPDERTPFDLAHVQWREPAQRRDDTIILPPAAGPNR